MSWWCQRVTEQGEDLRRGTVLMDLGAPAHRTGNISGCRELPVQGSSPTFTSPLCPLPPLSCTNRAHGILLEFFWNSSSPLNVKIVVPVSEPLFLPSFLCMEGMPGAVLARMGSFFSRDLGTDPRHCNCRGKSKTQGVSWLHRDLSAWKCAAKGNLVHSHLAKRRESPIVRVVQPLAPNYL